MEDQHEERVRATLDELGVDYEIIACDPDLADTANFCAEYGYRLDESANTIVVGSRTDPKQYVACVVLANTRLDVNRTVRKKMGVRKASFASADETRDITGMLIGGVTAVGLPVDLPLWIDQRVMDQERIILGGGSRSCKVAVAPDVLVRMPSAEVVEGLATPVES